MRPKATPRLQGAAAGGELGLALGSAGEEMRKQVGGAFVGAKFAAHCADFLVYGKTG